MDFIQMNLYYGQKFNFIVILKGYLSYYHNNENITLVQIVRRTIKV